MPNQKNELKRSSYLIFFPLVFFMLILEIVRLPASIAPYRPDFTGMLLIFFAITDPKRINIGVAWLTGLVIDFLTGATLGINALVLSGQVFIILSQFQHFARFKLWQQMLVIGIVNFICHVGVYWCGHLLGQSSYSTNFTWQTIVTILTWPLIYILCMFLWKSFNINGATSKDQTTSD